MIVYVLVFLLSVFISSVSQVLLKKSALRTYPDRLHEYMNPLVITAYTIFVISTLLDVFMYRYLPVNLGPVLETTSYVYVTLFGVMIFKEKVGRKKIAALALIVAGILIYAFC